MSNTLQFTTISHPHQFPKFRGGTDQGTRRMEDSCQHQQQQQQYQHHQDSLRTLSSITTKLTMSPHDKSTMVAVEDHPLSRHESTSSSFDMSSSASSTYSETSSHVSSAPTTPVSDSVCVPFQIDLKTIDAKIGEALATPKASAVPKPAVEDDVTSGQETKQVWQDDDEEHIWHDYDSDETDEDDDGSEWETESSGHEASEYSDDDCGIEFGHSDDEEEDDGEDDGLFGYDSAEEDDVFGSDSEDDEKENEAQLPTLPNVDTHRSERPPLRPCLSHAHASQPMKRSESTGSRVRFSETAEKPQVIQTRVFMYSYYEFDNMVRSSECPKEIRSAFEDKRTEMEKFRELQALKEFYISLLDPSEQEKERAKPEFEIVGRMEHFLISKMIEEKGEDVLVEDPEKCTQLLMGLVGFGSLKLDEEEKKDLIKKRREGTVPPTATPAETPPGSDGEWETEDEDN